MPAGFTILDLVAVGVFFAVWFLYNLGFSGRWCRPTSINAVMVTLRRAWMSRLLMHAAVAATPVVASLRLCQITRLNRRPQPKDESR